MRPRPAFRLLTVAIGFAVACILGCPSCQRQHVAPASTTVAPDPTATISSTTHRPAILFASPNGAPYLDLDYLRELHAQGFDIDYTDKLEELTHERLQSFNAVVLFTTPNAVDLNRPNSPDRIRSFDQMITDYLAIGGGVFLMPEERNLIRQQLAEISEPLGARLPAEQIVENNSDNIAPMLHPGQGLRLAFTDHILTSPVTEGVHSIWYPYEQAYCAAMTIPLVLTDDWTVLVRASSTAITKPVDLHAAIDVAPNLLVRQTPENSPAIMAVRTAGLGRVALVAEWPQFSVGAGTKWLYDREVLDHGLAGRRSDFGRLLSNTFRWLAEPSLRRESLGGFATRDDRLLAPNASEAVKALFRSRPPAYDPKGLGTVTLPAGKTLYRGLIGARTAFSSGSGSVADYARAARRAHLDFVVFLEDFDHMTREKLTQLSADCEQSSSADLLLLPGYSVTSNLGNHLFFFAPHPAWPPDAVLTGQRKNILYVQEQSTAGLYTGYKTSFLEWVAGAYHPDKGQVGYYDFVESPHGIRLHDARLYAMAGLRYYRKGALVEDILDDYLTTVASTIAPTPVAINEVNSPNELEHEAASGHSMTFAEAASLDATKPNGLFYGALRWTSQYDAMSAFVSSGPRILSWPDCHRVSTYGAEQFAPERSAADAPLYVQSAVGLREIRIYDGTRLFRRFLSDGAQTFETHLVLDGEVQRNLVVVASDRRGGIAVSFPWRSWSDDSLAPVFCSDHINDCQFFPLLAHGPWSFRLGAAPLLPVDVGGRTWDGGQPPILSTVGRQDTLAELLADEGAASAVRLDPIPVLEFADSGAVGVQARRLEAYDDRLLKIINPWNTSGPIAGVAQWFDNIQRYRQWVAPTIGPPAAGWAAKAVRTGASASLFTSTLRFRRTVHVRSLDLAQLHPAPGTALVVGNDANRQVFDLAAASQHDVALPAGSWFAVYGKEPMNAHILWNRGDALRLHVGAALDIFADTAGARFRPGDEYTFEVSGLAFPLDRPIEDQVQVERYVDFLRDPAGLRILRGARRRSPGLLELDSVGGSAELSLPRAPGLDGLTLPVRVTGLNPRWSAGLLQKDGYTPGFYGSGRDRYRALGIDTDGAAYVPLYVDRADTWVAVGHPLVADAAGHDLFVQVTCLGGSPFRWHVSVNNAGDHAITTVLHQALTLPGLEFPDRQLTVAAGAYVILQ